MAKPANEAPDASEFGQIRAFLATNGFSQAWIDNAIGTQPNGRTRAEITAELRLALKDLPKA